jgi:hypothetical protein
MQAPWPSHRPFATVPCGERESTELAPSHMREPWLQAEVSGARGALSTDVAAKFRAGTGLVAPGAICYMPPCRARRSALSPTAVVAELVDALA